MPLDAICMTALVYELRPLLVGAKIDKVRQPGRDEIVLALRGTQGNGRLLMTANPSHPRLQMTEETPENPASPPMFCMLLRKHLTGGRILSVTQPPMERVVDLELEALNELGERVSRHLILEAMGRRANLVLTDGDNRIIDCLRRLDADMSAQRQVLPGLFYRLPPKQDKQDPLAVDQQTFALLAAQAPPQRKAVDWLLDTFGGISPLVARELVFRACGDVDGRMPISGLSQSFLELVDGVKANNFSPYLLIRDGRAFDFSFQPILQYGPQAQNITRESFSVLLDEFYSTRELADRVRQKGQDLLRTVTNLRDRAARKLGIQAKELQATQEREQLREKGDIITSNLHRMERGMSVLRAQNFYDPDCGEVEIALNPLLTPQQNAAKYYKDYNKAKNAQFYLTGQMEKGRVELDYLESVLEAIHLAEGERDLQEIRQELTDAGYLRRPGKSGKKEKRVSAKPLEFQSTDGLRISVGKNNTQNDLLTTKMAFKSDWWFHTQKIHGSHVVLWTQGNEPPAQSVLEAAMLAAWFSQARGSDRVPVDYTPVKYVKKPAGAKPGMVIYETYRTAAVTPEAELVKRLRVK